MKRIVLFLITITILIGVVGCGGNEETVEDNEEVVEVKGNFEIVEKEDLSTPMSKRYNWHVVIEEPVNTEELEGISKQVVEIAKEEEKFNAIVIGFYDYQEYIGSGYTLGKVEYAPEGDWAKADSVKAGEYDKMDYNLELKEKDWETRLTEREVEIYAAWQELLLDNGDEEVTTTAIADRFDISEDEVNEILMKQITWTFNDIK